MLILTRRPHEVIRIGNHIRVTVLGFKGNQVRLGIEAPADVGVDREEIWIRKQREARGESDVAGDILAIARRKIDDQDPV